MWTSLWIWNDIPRVKLLRNKQRVKYFVLVYRAYRLQPTSACNINSSDRRKISKVNLFEGLEFNSQRQGYDQFVLHIVIARALN